MKYQLIWMSHTLSAYYGELMQSWWNVQYDEAGGSLLVLRIQWVGWMNQAYSRLSTTHGHITDCKLYSVAYAGVYVVS